MKVIATLALLALAACGADGAPERPEPKQQGGAISVGLSGTASIGITG